MTVVDEDGVPFKPGATQFDNILKLYSGMTDHVFTKEELEQGRMYGQTCTRMYRNYWRTLSKEDLAFYFSLKKANGDMKSSLLAYCLGKVWCSGDTCAAHRKCLTNDSYTASTWGKNNCARVQDGLMELEQLAAYFQKDISFRDRIAANTLSAFQFYLKNRTKENRDILRTVWNNDPHHGYTLAWCGKLAMKKIQKKIGRK